MTRVSKKFFKTLKFANEHNAVSAQFSLEDINKLVAKIEEYRLLFLEVQTVYIKPDQERRQREGK